MSSQRHHKVAIVGAGPTGLTAACLLLRYGVSCRIVDAAPGPTQRSRAIGVSARSLEVLDEFGTADELVTLGLPSGVANFYARGRRIAVLTSARTSNTRFPFLLAVPQTATERVLESRLHALGGNVERGVEVTGLHQLPDRVELHETHGGSESRSTASWVVAADGSHSILRKALKIPFEGTATGNVFANVDAVLDPGPKPGVGHYYFSPEGLLVVAPLPNGVYRVTASIPAERGTGTQLTPTSIEDLLARRTGSRTRVLKLKDAGWGVATFAVQARIATQFSSGRCFLAGDAAHVFGPTGAQGMNAGIQDAHNLAWKLALVIRGAAAEPLLMSYDSERRPVAHRVLHSVEEQTRMAMVRGAVARRVRDVLLSVASRTGALDRLLAPRVNQLDVTYAGTEGILGSGRRSSAGRRLPDVRVGPGGETLYGRLRDLSFHLVVLGANAAQGSGLSERVRAALPDAVELALHPVQARGTTGAGALVDVDGTLAAFLGRSGAARVALVRPDGYVAATGALDDLEAVLAHLRSRVLHLHPPMVNPVSAPNPARDLP